MFRAQPPRRNALNASTPAQLYATVAGALLVVLGIVGFFYEASFETDVPGVETGEIVGVLTVNGWHNLFHLLAGLAGLAAAGSGAARPYALGVGLLFAVVAIWGFFAADDVILSLLPVDAAGNVLHLVIGLLGLGAGAASPVAPARET